MWKIMSVMPTVLRALTSPYSGNPQYAWIDRLVIEEDSLAMRAMMRNSEW
jgi:hypothetical protein